MNTVTRTVSCIHATDYMFSAVTGLEKTQGGKYPNHFWFGIRTHAFTRAGFCDPRVGLLGAQVFPHHLLERAHEHRDEAVDVAGVVTAS